MFFQQMANLSGVSRVKNMPQEMPKVPLDFFFFLCPAMSSAGIKVNKLETGFRAKYVPGLNKTAPQRLARAEQFSQSCRRAGIAVTVTGIWASADALILFPVPHPRPAAPLGKFGNLRVVENYGIVSQRLRQFGELYRSQPWLGIPKKIRDQEEFRLRSMLPDASERLKQDFFRRIWAGFALDGLLIRQLVFGGKNPAILGVEAPSVALFQNAALLPQKRLPVVQLE